MKRVQQADLERLMKAPGGDCVSIFMPLAAPHQRTGDAIRLKGFLTDAESQLVDRGMAPVTARDLLAPAMAFIERLDAEAAGAKGLALFLCEDHFEVLFAPAPLREGLFVYSRFHITPLLPVLARNQAEYHVLAVSQNRVRLFKGSAEGLVEESVADLPANMTEALNYQSPEHGIQFHGGVKAGEGQRATVYHGQGGIDDFKHDELIEYLRKIDAAVSTRLRGCKSLLFFAGVDRLLPLYRSVTECRQLAEESLHGNFDRASAEELFAEVWPLVQRRIEQSIGVAVQRCAISADEDPAAHELAPILRAAQEGRIDTLVVALDRQVWGRFDTSTNRVHIATRRTTDDEELINLAAILTLDHRGQVVAIHSDVAPGHADVAAVFRYPMHHERVAVAK